jgi:hypothetical protein
LITLGRRILRNQKLRVGNLLQGDRILSTKRLKAREIGLRLGVKGSVLGQLSLRVLQSRLEEKRVDLGEDAALFDRLAFDKIDLLEHTRHLALDRGRIQGLNCSNAGKHDGLVVLLDLRGDDRDRGSGRRRRSGLVSWPPMDDGERCGCQGDNDAALAAYGAERLAYGQRVVRRGRHLGPYMQAQIASEEEQRQAQHFRKPEVVMTETASMHGLDNW